MSTVERHRLPFDPIEEAAKQWATLWGEMPRMRAVTSLMRVHQLLLTELDELLRPLGLTFARYEVLVLLSFSRRGVIAVRQDRRTPSGPCHLGDAAGEAAGSGRVDPAYAPSRGRPRSAGLDHSAGTGRHGEGDRRNRQCSLRTERVERGGMRSADLVAHHAARGRRRLLTASRTRSPRPIAVFSARSRIIGTRIRRYRLQGSASERRR